jgi:hypothetical protein
MSSSGCHCVIWRLHYSCGIRLIMRRPFISSLLMIAYLVSQLAAVPHAHGAGTANQLFDHNARPHIHVSWIEHGDHSHDHHSHDGHSHHHDREGSQSSPTSSGSNSEHGSHDNDALYLPNDVGVSFPSKVVVSLDCLQSVSTLGTFAIANPVAISEPSVVAVSPGECRPDCPLYLALRALRI